MAGKLRLAAAGAYLDLACGTGNYTVALSTLGGAWSGVDASEVMLAQARSKASSVAWCLASADSLPFADATFDGAICTLAIHHFPALESSFAEIRRTLRSGCFAIFTGLAEQMHRYWLCHYFPQMMARSIEKMPSESEIRAALSRAGFRSVAVTPFFVTPKLQDLFLYSGKHRPELYLDSAIRANISSFSGLAPTTELREGLAQLTADLQSGAFASVKARYFNELGDYAYVTARAG
ncbi:MAG: class I SAM-dependent methyltransferase [Ideonella sp.]|nr:class I SAM-dependent methyltransferase [Ideonella sp.]MCC7456459.1 class I SAM-dependent methyltransferase [Nitrospira sp.]